MSQEAKQESSRKQATWTSETNPQAGCIVPQGIKKRIKLQRLGSKRASMQTSEARVIDGVERRPRASVSLYFECTRHNVRRAWSRWQDAGASVQVHEWIHHGVFIPWLLGGLPTPFNDGISCHRFPKHQDSFLKEEIVRLAEKGVLRPIEHSRWVSRVFLEPKTGGGGWSSTS